jgi:hypothetical protein
VTSERFLDGLAPSGITKAPYVVEGAIASRELLLAPLAFRSWCGLFAITAGRRRGDLLAGVTVAAYLVPQVMAYAMVAGPAVAGLWGVWPRSRSARHAANSCSVAVATSPTWTRCLDPGKPVVREIVGVDPPVQSL